MRQNVLICNNFLKIYHTADSRQRAFYDPDMKNRAQAGPT
jgi:trimethylamine:corrinoid methyltransferase-like protein